MKRLFISIIFLLVLLPVTINAECDYEKNVELNKLAGKITYETSYSKSTKKFSVTFYNVYLGELYLRYGNKLYHPDRNGETVIENVSQGTVVDALVLASDSECSAGLLTIYVKIPFYNDYYKSIDCTGYENLLVCSSQFLDYEVTPQIFMDAIKNYNDKLNYKVEKPDDKDKNIVTLVVDFAKNWGLKILLIVVSAGIAFFIFNTKFRKVKHGI